MLLIVVALSAAVMQSRGSEPGHFLPLDTRAAVPARLRPTCGGLAWGDRHALLDSEASLNRLAGSDSSAPEVLTQLGCVRAALMVNGAFGQPGYGMQLGTSWAHGAAVVLEQALAIAPRNTLAARTLTLVGLWAGGIPPPAKPIEPRRVTDPEPLSPIANALFRAVAAGVRDSVVLRGCTSYLLDTGDFRGARECSSRALEYGADSTWHLLRLAYVAFHVGDSILGSTLFHNAVAAARDSTSRSELGWQLDFRRLPGLPARLFAAPLDRNEREDWLGLADSSARVHWLDDRWQSLAGAKGLTPTAILATHFSSVTYGLGSFLVCMETIPGGTSRAGVGTPDAIEPCFPDLLPDVHGLDLAASLYRLWDPKSGAVQAVGTYAMPLPRLVEVPNSTGIIVTLEFSVRQQAFHDRWLDTTFSRTSQVPDGATAGVLEGLAVLPSAPDVTEWHLLASQSANRRSIVTEQGLAPLDTGPLALSDIVLGAPDQQMAWTPPGDSVWLMPLGAADHDRPLTFYVQIRSDTTRDARFALAIFRVDHGVAAATPALQIIDQIRLSPGLNPTHRVFGASRLKAGSYEFRLTVTDAKTGLSAQRRTDLNLR